MSSASSGFYPAANGEFAAGKHHGGDGFLPEQKENESISKIREYIFDTYSLSDINDSDLKKEIRKYTDGFKKTKTLPVKERERITRTVYSSIRGLDIIDELLEDDSVSEIMINSYDCIFTEKKGVIRKSSLKFESRRRFEDIIERAISMSGREVNYAMPIADAILPGGDRVNVVLPPVAVDGPNMTVRKFSKHPMSMETLIKNGTLTQQAADFLKELVRAKYNIFVSGGTSSGKTTFLNVLSDYIPENERIITIEDSAELRLRNSENLIRLQSRNRNTAGAGEITMRDLIKTSLRMRPERIIVGEVRGAEAMDMLQAMNTGHDGSLSTGHANSCADMLLRLETMVLSADYGMPLSAVRQQMCSALDIIVHLSRDKDGKRKIIQICEVGKTADGNIKTNSLFERNAKGELKRTKAVFNNTFKLEISGVSGNL